MANSVLSSHAMMGYQPGFEPKFFYHQINLDQRVPRNHVLRKIQDQIDFDFIYAEGKDSYGDNGNVSIPAPAILKMMLLLIFYNVCLERKLMDTIPLRLGWLWFFGYDPGSDTYRCPAGNRLRPKSLRLGRQSRDYAASKKICAACHLREQCTKNKSGRTIKRHLRQEELDKMREASRSAKARRDIKTRQHLMERSFARGTRYGYDQARWRGFWGAQIQEYLIAAIQNLQFLLKYGTQATRGLAFKVDQVKRTLTQAIGLVLDGMKALLISNLVRIVSLPFVSFGYIKSGNLRFQIL